MEKLAHHRNNHNELLEAALRYAKTGWAVIPCSGKRPVTQHGWKDGSSDPARIRQWWKQWPKANVGIVTGYPSGNLLVLDVDGEEGKASLAELERRRGLLPMTLIVQSGGGGLHYYLRIPPGVRIGLSPGELPPGLDIRCDGGYIIAPPSIHPDTGNPYRFLSNEEPAPCPDWLLKKIQQPVKKKRTATNGAGKIPKGRQHTTLCSRAGTMRRCGMSAAAIEDALVRENQESCEEPIPENEVRCIARDIGNKPNGVDETQAEDPPKPNGSDVPNGNTTVIQDVPTTTELLDIVYASLGKYLILSDAQRIILPIWTLHTYVYEKARLTPYVRISSPTKRCGKTNLIDFEAAHVANPWRTDGCTAAALVRKIDRDHPTLLLDETDAAFGRDAEYTNHMRGIINSGFSRKGSYTVCVGQGANITTRDLGTFSPKAFSGIGNLPDTIMDRSIPISMRRKKPSEDVSDFDDEDVENDARTFVSGAGLWKATFQMTRPERLDKLNDRQRGVSQILLAIADTAPGHWAKNAREALVELFTGDRSENNSDTELLLTHLSKLFGNIRPEANISSVEICSRLNQEETWPWSIWRKGLALNPWALSSLLRPFGIVPDNVRIGERILKGYKAADLQEVFDRYCPRVSDD